MINKRNLQLGILSLFLMLPHLSASAAEAKPISCGPYLDTYQPISLSGETGNGIRCVKSTNAGKADRAVVFAWYGEGVWGDGRTYRHLGQAIKKSSKSHNLTGYASDIWGNGEYANGNFAGNLEIKIINKNTIKVTGAWNEKWKKVESVDYAWMANPSTCGDYLKSYIAYGTEDLKANQPGKNGQGLRCELTIGKAGTTWLGFGNWGSNTYSHLATKNAKGEIGSSDFCKEGEVCYTALFGYLKRNYSRLLDGITIDYWGETWKMI